MPSTDLTGRLGACTCGSIRYELLSTPLFVHCCHCTWCQRETGTAFALNGLVEARQVDVRAGQVELVLTPSASGRGQKVARCPTCRVAVWSHYTHDDLSFVRLGTLDDRAGVAPDIHIFTSTKQAWLTLDTQMPSVAEYYRTRDHWPPASLERVAALKASRVA